MSLSGRRDLRDSLVGEPPAPRDELAAALSAVTKAAALERRARMRSGAGAATVGENLFSARDVLVRARVLYKTSCLKKAKMLPARHTDLIPFQRPHLGCHFLNTTFFEMQSFPSSPPRVPPRCALRSSPSRAASS